MFRDREVPHKLCQSVSKWPILGDTPTRDTPRSTASLFGLWPQIIVNIVSNASVKGKLRTSKSTIMNIELASVLLEVGKRFE